MDRKAFLERIGRRLGRPLPQQAPDKGVVGLPDAYERELRVDAAASEVTRAERFKAELEALGGQAFIEASPASAGERLKAVLRELHPRKMVSWAREEFKAWPVDWLWEEAGCVPWPELQEAPALRSRWRSTALEADVGITTAEFALAETGTLLLCAGPGKPRSASLLPRVHLALVPRSQLVARMGDIPGRGFLPAKEEIPSACFLITGPSRTSDIENDLTIGVHGPGQLLVILG